MGKQVEIVFSLACRRNDNDDNNNTAIGQLSLYSNTTGQYNTAIGSGALISNTIGNGNTATGILALQYNTGGSWNTAYGSTALFRNVTGILNDAFGDNALGQNTTGNNNVGIGYSSNYYNQEGSQNTIIGSQAGQGPSLHTKSGNIFLGYQAGYNETGNNKLYIENSNSDTPLIYGEFDNDIVTINGEMHVEGTNGLVCTGIYNSGSIPIENDGVRMMWYPSKAAFRAGRVTFPSANFWNDDSIGVYSFATGSNTRARGTGSTAVGVGSAARGNYSIVYWKLDYSIRK